MDLEKLWSLQTEAAAIDGQASNRRLAGRDLGTIRRCARVLDRFGYLDFIAERVTERGKWLADLRVRSPAVDWRGLAAGSVCVARRKADVGANLGAGC
jgi:hypothetical protein